uniref:Uncharacterized protein n=1 Tax=viral metagenome TaxID=1070528 RepID=A0A6C0C632_9ZZZZ
MADMDNIFELFGDIDEFDNDTSVQKNENYYISQILKLMNDADEFPLYIYCMIKTILTRKEVLNNAQIKEIADILNIKPVVKEKVVIKEKIVYKDRKTKLNNYDDY